MELSAQAADGTHLLYREGFWTGRKALTVEGVEATKLGRKLFRITGEGGRQTTYTVQGNFVAGVKVTISETNEVVVLAKNRWYDWLLIFLPLLGIVFGAGFCGMVGGGLSGLFCFAACVANAQIARSRLPLGGKIPLEIGVTIVANGIWFAIWFVIAWQVVTAATSAAAVLPLL